jgi:hypothetical protein
MHGSVAESVLRRTRMPILLVSAAGSRLEMLPKAVAPRAESYAGDAPR